MVIPGQERSWLEESWRGSGGEWADKQLWVSVGNWGQVKERLVAGGHTGRETAGDSGSEAL